MDRFNSLKVYYNDKVVGTLARTKDNLVAFEYDNEWINSGFSISPLSLPLVKRVFVPRPDPLNGMFGVFCDSLPDGWGRLLVDRMLLKNNVEPAEIDELNRLAIVQHSGMGALEYRPIHELTSVKKQYSLDELAKACEELLSQNYTKNLDELFEKGGSSGGARPKVLVKIEGEDWIIKFPTSQDDKNIGEQEYKYSLCAKECGINMSKTRLFPADNCSGYFGIKRFDRNGEKRIHMVSAGGLLETSHRLPNLDYNLLMRLTLHITRNYGDVEQLYRLMCFNVFAHNRDDHSKNFSYIFDDEKNEWHLSPAYDLTYSNSFGGEHATTINGEGKNPTMDDILAVAQKIDIKPKQAKEIAEFVKDKVSSNLGK